MKLLKRQPHRAWNQFVFSRFMPNPSISQKNIFWSIGTVSFNTFILGTEFRSTRSQAAWGMSHLPLSLMNRLNQTRVCCFQTLPVGSLFNLFRIKMNCSKCVEEHPAFSKSSTSLIKWAASWKKQNKTTSAQSDQRRKLASLATHWAHSEDSDQTGRIPRLIWVFAGCTLILLVLSWGGSNVDRQWPRI